MTIVFGREVCGDLSASESKEWLITNGIGGYAMGTVAGTLTRQYHGLLIASLRPPLGRTLLLAKLEESINYDGRTFPLYANRWVGDNVRPSGFQFVESFWLEGTVPVWKYALVDALLEKRIWMLNGENATYIQYRLLRASSEMQMSIKVLVNHRDHHGLTGVGGIRFQVDVASQGLRVSAADRDQALYLASDRMTLTADGKWQDGYYLSQEAYRGLPDTDAHFCAAQAIANLEVGKSVHLLGTVKPDAVIDGEQAFARRMRREENLLSQAGIRPDEEPKGIHPRSNHSPGSPVSRLVLAADQFIVKRETPAASGGLSIIAGYPWFGDWSRDTMIALPGLALETGRSADAAQILRTYAGYVDRGMIPNRFPNNDSFPEYNTADAALWYFEALHAYLQSTGDNDLIKELYPILADIINRHIDGTRYNIGLDPEDGLLFAGAEGTQLTWMDAKLGDWVVTPRIGKPVEINALWYNALSILASFARQLNRPWERYRTLADSARMGFARFWNESAGCCYDVIDGKDGNDPAIRPNQILAVSLHYSPLGAMLRKGVVDTCARHLLIPFGLRSLAPDSPLYRGTYGGDLRQRDGAYHQGTAWGWLIGPFITAHLRVYGDVAAARSMIMPLLHHLNDRGLGTVSEIFDGDPPYTARGCPAQAWSVAGLITAMRMCGLWVNSRPGPNANLRIEPNLQNGADS